MNFVLLLLESYITAPPEGWQKTWNHHWPDWKFDGFVWQRFKKWVKIVALLMKVIWSKYIPDIAATSVSEFNITVLPCHQWTKIYQQHWTENSLTNVWMNYHLAEICRSCTPFYHYNATHYFSVHDALVHYSLNKQPFSADSRLE